MINASSLSKLVGIAYSSALNILKKLMMVIENHMHENTISVPSAVFSSVVAKRSRETRARAHPQTEIEDANRQVHMDDEGAHREDERGELSADDREELSPQERQIYDALSSDPVQFDSLCERIKMPVAELSAHLTMLEIKGFVERMAGDRYRKMGPLRSMRSGIDADTTCSKVDKLQSMINEMIAFVRSIYHTVSRKYLQNYLAAYWCGSDRARWNIGSLLQGCHRIPHITDSEILNYVSPNLLKIIVDSSHCA
jgi:DNA-binding transcriptional ArsR family regulator